MRLPDFVIVGAMRSGTTTLSRVLGEIPGVDIADRKEIHFFDDQYSRGLGWYADLFASLPDVSVVGEATPNYMHDPIARDRLLTDLPHSRFVAILRNPIDRAWSHYWFNVSRAKESLSFEDALKAEPLRLQASTVERRIYSYVDRGRYADQLLPLVERTGGDRIHLMYFEDFLAQPAAELRSLMRFLGPELHGDVDADVPQVNRYVEFRSIRVRKLVTRLPKPLGRVLGRLNARTGVAYPSMTTQTRRVLQEQLAQAVTETASLVGRDPLRWGDWY
jgi:hypothetical protein